MVTRSAISGPGDCSKTCLVRLCRGDFYLAVGFIHLRAYGILCRPYGYAFRAFDVCSRDSPDQPGKWPARFRGLGLATLEPLRL
jgi:hypothetical protein